MVIDLGSLLNLSDKVAIVTGGALGIGRGIAERLAQAGAAVVIADIDVPSGEKTQQDLSELGYQVAFIKCDVSSEEDVKNLVDQSILKFGRIDILVNNAGIYPPVEITQMRAEDFQKVLDINLKGVFLCTKYVSQSMIDKGEGGRIINITSIDALHPSMIGLAHYDASKHGMWGFTKNSALELSKYKIWVNAIAPGGISTEGTAKMQDGQPQNEDIIKQFLQKIPMQRMGEPDDIAKVALFFASDMSSYITGSQLVVDGGVLLR